MHVYIVEYIAVYHIKIYFTSTSRRRGPARLRATARERKENHNTRERPPFLRRAIQETHHHTGVREEKQGTHVRSTYKHTLRHTRR